MVLILSLQNFLSFLNNAPPFNPRRPPGPHSQRVLPDRSGASTDLTEIIVTAWNNGKYYSNGAGYGFRISEADRDRHLSHDWKELLIRLDGNGDSFIKVNIDKKSFWYDCKELIKKDIGAWLIRSGRAPWPKGSPPKVRLTQIDGNRFKASLIEP